MNYLDVNPMIAALRDTPDEFELANGWLNHIRSRHGFKFSPNDEVEIRAACDCTLLAVRSEQQRDLSTAYREWESNYWRPLQINREFASHFAARSALHQLLISLSGRLHRWLLRLDGSSGVAVSLVKAN
jgi:hypothetical protein